MAENFYQILGLGVRASQAEIKSAYKKLALKYHPDRHQGAVEYEEKFKKILEAYQTLSDPLRKDRYDMSLFYRAVSGKESSASSSPDPVYRNVPRTPRERDADAYQRRQADRQAYRDFKGPPESKRLTPHNIAIALLVVSSFVMISYWLGYAMNQHMAKKSLSRGDFVAALQYDDEYAEAYYVRYQAEALAGSKPSVLLADLNLALRFADREEPEWLMNRGMVLLSMDSLDAAERDFLQARKADAKNDSLCLILAEFYSVRKGNHDKGLAWFEAALKINPSNYSALKGKAGSLYRLKRFSLAIPVLNDCIVRGGNDRELFFLRGSALLALGKKDDACLDLNQALNMGYDEALPLVESYCGGGF